MAGNSVAGVSQKKKKKKAIGRGAEFQTGIKLAHEV